ncbi:hypothetical protein BVC93_12035 [Mycobacterium sp. MS1601]|uniref:DUF3566 domain-containing protein n=1 Tax=Mycobacterium sp. MS1601 TaxID=1936029 RepID=UPI0009792828|nr:DUF3566 domain-containing protein [Mycobacterium sp. MS1601]AQA03041.1 hypothetical protein BVC93_12035 [Mycobacterium sp. MS1601]
MSSPKDPGHAAPGDSPANGHGGERTGAGARPASPPARVGEGGEVPPWQRGAGRPQQSGPARPVESQRPSAPPERPTRYLAGTAAPGAQAPTDATKEYASELPDLSAAAPRPQQQRKPAEAPSAQRSGGGRVQVAPRTKDGPVRASMQIRRVDPWSAMKVSLLLSVALFFVWMIAVAVLYLVLGGMGVWTKLNSNVGDLLTSTSGSTGGELVSSGTIFGGALLIGLVNIVLLTALATVGAFIYNVTTDIVGGVEVTLADRD